MSSFFRLKSDFDIGCGPVIKKEDFSSYVSGEALLSDAKKEAQRIIAEAKKVYEKEKERGYLEGVSKGLEDSENKLSSEAKKQADALKSQYELSIKELRESMPKIIKAAVGKIFGDMEGEESLKRVIRESLKHPALSGEIRLYVSEADYEALKASLSSFKEAKEDISDVELLRSSSLEPSSFKILSDSGIVESSPKEQLYKLEGVLSEADFDKAPLGEGL